MTVTPVTATASDPAAPAAAAATPAAVDATALETQIAELKEQIAESNRTAEFWADKAKKSSGTPAPVKQVVEEEDDTDVLEAITTGGTKGFDALAKKRGFIKRDEVEALIDTRATSLTKEQELIGRYPDLKKPTSDFFKATAAHYGDLVKGGTPQAQAMELAAERTELQWMREGKIKPAAETTKAEKETARLERVKAQSGEGGRRQAAPVEEGDDELTEQQKHIADAMGISHEAYGKRAKAGVSIKGR